MISDYPYSKHNLLLNPEKYQKSSFNGITFLESYKKSRLNFLTEDQLNFSISHYIKNFSQENNSNEKIILEKYLERILENFESKSSIQDLDLLIKKFEISKKLFIIIS